jgi:hypothetical protein
VERRHLAWPKLTAMRDLDQREWRMFGCVRLSRPEWLLAVLLLLCYTYFFPRFADWNQNSRLALVFAIVHEGRMEIDSYDSMTGDYAEYNGHHYSDKAPGPALLGVPIYATVRPILESAPVTSFLRRLSHGDSMLSTIKDSAVPQSKVNWAVAQLVLTWCLVTFPSIFLILTLYRVVGVITDSPRVQCIVVLAYALATSAFPYSSNYYSHQLVAALLFTSFALLWRVHDATRRRLFVVGLLMGLAVISEYSAVLIASGIGLYTLLILRNRLRMFWLILGGIPALALLALHNSAIYGTPLVIGYSHSAFWRDDLNSGFFSLTMPTLESIWGITFSSYRGLFFVSPILLIGLAGFATTRWPRCFRLEWLICAWSVLSFFLFNSATVLWSGGFGVGPRYLVPMLPFLVIPMVFAVETWGTSCLFRLAFVGALVWSVIATWSLSIATQSLPTFVQNPLLNLSLPALAAGDVARNWGMLIGLKGIWSLVPLGLLAGLLSFCLIRESTRGTIATATARMDAGPCDETDHSRSVQTGSPSRSPGWIDRVADRGVGGHRVRPPLE